MKKDYGPFDFRNGINQLGWFFKILYNGEVVGWITPNECYHPSEYKVIRRAVKPTDKVETPFTASTIEECMDWVYESYKRKQASKGIAVPEIPFRETMPPLQ